MKSVLAAIALLSLSAASNAQEMTIAPAGSQPATLGSAENFDGNVFVDPWTSHIPGQRPGAALVTFAPAAHSFWHTHPAGQTLIVTSGSGWVQQWGQPRRSIRAGDVIWTPPGVKHWHGATKSNGMAHIAMQNSVDGKNVTWLERVSGDQYVAD